MARMHLDAFKEWHTEHVKKLVNEYLGLAFNVALNKDILSSYVNTPANLVFIQHGEVVGVILSKNIRR